MNFDFGNADYHLNKAWGVNKEMKGKRIMETMIRAHANPLTRAENSPQKIYSALKAAGVGYRKTNCLQDISRAMATEFSKSNDAYHRSNQWWEAAEQVFNEPTFKHRYDATKYMNRYKQKSFKNEAEARLAGSLEDEGWMKWQGTTPHRL